MRKHWEAVLIAFVAVGTALLGFGIWLVESYYPSEVASTPTPRPTAYYSTYRSTRSSSRTTYGGEPYVGQHISGTPADWSWQGTDSTTVKSSTGGAVRTVKYRFDTSTRSYTIWVNDSGSVVKVNYSDRTGTSRSTGRRSSVSPSLDTSDWYHPEDFYDWNRDDFDDYEDAEDYYYSHGGK